MLFSIPLTKKIGLDNKEFLFQFQSHQNYPSALSLSDTLNFMGVKCDAYELDKEYWQELPKEFITIYKSEFALVKNIGQDNYTIYSESTENISKEELYKDSQDFVLLFEKTKELEKKSTFSFKLLLYSIFGVIFLYSVIFQTWYEALYTFFSIVGIYISLELFHSKYGQISEVLNNICGAGNKKETNEDSCSKIIQFDTFNILGLKLSDFSLIYFISILLIGLFLPVSGFGLKYLNFATLIVIGYSLYIQFIKEKTFCKICFAIILILISQLIISSLFFKYFFSFQVLFLSIICFAVVFFQIKYENDTLAEKEKIEKENIKNLRFKRNYEIFKKELLGNEKIEFENNQLFFVGNQNAKLHITLISNPYCGFCKDAHHILEKLLYRYSDCVSAQIRFNYLEGSTQEVYKMLITDFVNVYHSNNNINFLKAIALWFQNKNENEIHKKFNSLHKTNDLTEIFKISKENIDNNFFFTPLFLINGYPFPKIYDREDIFYFIDELLEDEEIINEEKQAISVL